MTITKSTPSPSPSPTSGGEAAGAQKFQTTTKAAASSGRVWMPGALDATGLTGKDLRSLSEGAQARLGRRPAGGSWMSTEEAEGAYYNWNAKQRADFRAKALVGGLLQFGDGDIEAGKLWHSLVLQGANYGAQGQAVSPMDLLAGYVSANSNGQRWVKQGDFEVNPVTGERRYIGPQFKTTTATRVDLTDPASARAVATQIFQQLLGRDPGSGEISAYANALTASEVQNPSQQTTTTQYDMTTGEATDTSTVSSGGVTADGQAMLAADQVKGKKEYGVTQAATTYMNALEGAVYGSH